MKRGTMVMCLVAILFPLQTVWANQELDPLIGPRETKIEKVEPEDYGAIVIPKDIFPEGNGLPIPIYIPPVTDNSNASFGDWANVKEIAGENIRFSKEKLLRNLAKLIPPEVPEGPGYDVGVGAAFSVGGAILLAFEQAFEKNGFKITIQRNSQGNFRAVIEIFSDEGNVIRTNAGSITGVSSPATGVAAIAFSRYLEDKFSLPPSDALYQAFWIIDENHKRDPYVAYLALRPEKDTLVIIPKIYSGDKFKIAKIITPIWGPTILELRGREYVDAWLYLLPAQAPETLKVLELLPISLIGQQNVALHKPVSVTATGNSAVHEGYSPGQDGQGEWPEDITDGRLDYRPASDREEDGCVGWVNDQYNSPMTVKVTIDLQGTYRINKIWYNMGDVQRAETWNVDTMSSPFGTTQTNPGSSFRGAWTEQTGDATLSKVEIVFTKTRTSYATNWLFIGEIEIYGFPVSTPTDWKEYKLGALSFSVPSDWEVYIPPSGSFFDAWSPLERSDKRFVFFMVGITAHPYETPEGPEHKGGIVYYDKSGGKIEDPEAISPGITITHPRGKIVDSFKTEIAGRSVTVCVLHRTGERIDDKGVEYVEYVFYLFAGRTHHVFHLEGVDPDYLSTICKEFVSRIRLLPEID